MDILLAPFFSVLNLRFYRYVLGQPLRKGFLYLGYLTLLSGVFILGYVQLRLMPQIDRFAEWVEREIPPLTWTPDGLVVNAAMPYPMVHPTLGFLAVFDTTKTQVQPEEIGDFLFYVTSTNLYARQGPNEVRVYDLTRGVESLPPDRMIVRVNADTVRDYYRAMKPWAVFSVLVAFIPFFFVWKLFEAFVFSLVAALINLKCKPRLDYQTLFNLSLYVLTPVTLIQFSRLIFPWVARIPFGLGGSVLVAAAYLFLILSKQSEGDSASAD